MQKIKVHITEVRAGDSIEHNGKIMTVCNSDFSTGFMGLCVFGDSYRLGNLPVTKILFKRVLKC